MSFLERLLHLISEPEHPKESVRESKEMRANLTQGEIDKTLEDSFPASDPPAWY